MLIPKIIVILKIHNKKKQQEEFFDYHILQQDMVQMLTHTKTNTRQIGRAHV